MAQQGGPADFSKWEEGTGSLATMKNHGPPARAPSSLVSHDLFTRASRLTGRQLYNAAEEGQTATVRALLSTPGSQSVINWQDSDGRTPLYIAAQCGTAGVVALLIAARCDVDIANQETPLLGRRVVIKGLVKKPELNGRTGTINVSSYYYYI